GALRGAAAGGSARRVAPLPRAVLQGVHAEAAEVARPRRGQARPAGDPRRPAPQGARPEARRLPAGGRHREAHEGRDRHVRRRAGQGGGVMPYDNQKAYDRLIFEVSSPGRAAYSLAEADVPAESALSAIPAKY